MLPIVMRWREALQDGQRHWYLGSLRCDTSFWGYVHIRTETMNENRSFDGKLDATKYEQIRSLVDSVYDPGNNQGESETTDGIIGLGSRSDFITVIRYNHSPLTLPNAEIFRKIVDTLQPAVIAAANL